MEGGIRRPDHQSAEAARRLVRLVARALHHGRGAVPRRAQGVRRSLPRRAHLQGQAPGQLGPEAAHRHLRPRSRADRGEGSPLASALSARGSRLRSRGCIDLHRGRHHAARDHARRYRRRRASRRRSLQGSRRQACDPAAGRPPHPHRRRRIFGSREGLRRGEDHAGARLQRFRGRPTPRAAADQHPRAQKQKLVLDGNPDFIQGVEPKSATRLDDSRIERARPLRCAQGHRCAA